MVINLKIYKFSDPDMYALHNAGISVPALMKLAIAYKARGRRLRILVPDCLYCDLSGQKRHIPLKIKVTDKESVDYLRTVPKKGMRTANIKTILRGCMVEQITGPTLRDRQLVQAENARLMAEAESLKKENDVLILKPGMRMRSYYPMVLNPTVDLPYKEKGKKEASSAKKPGAKGMRDQAEKETPCTDVPKPVEGTAADGYAEPPSGARPPVPEGQDKAGRQAVQEWQADEEAPVPWQDGNTEEMTDEEAEEDFFSQFESLG